MPNEIEYRNEVQRFYYETLKWCGCGSPEAALKFMRDVLGAYETRIACSYSEESCAQVNALLPPESPLALSYMYLLDSLDFTEHGGSVGGAWLTDKGKQVLALLQCDLEDAMDSDNI